MLPPKRHRHREPFDIGNLNSSADCLDAQRRIVLAHAAGELDDDLAESLSKSVAAAAKLFDGAAWETRMSAIESRISENAREQQTQKN